MLSLFFGKNIIAVAMLSMRTVISKRLEDVPSRTISKTQLLAADELGPYSATPPVAYFKGPFIFSLHVFALNLSPPPPPPGVLPIMAYTGRLRPKGVSFSGFRYMKG